MFVKKSYVHILYHKELANARILLSMHMFSATFNNISVISWQSNVWVVETNSEKKPFTNLWRIV